MGLVDGLEVPPSRRLSLSTLAALLEHAVFEALVRQVMGAAFLWRLSPLPFVFLVQTLAARWQQSGQTLRIFQNNSESACIIVGARLLTCLDRDELLQEDIEQHALVHLELEIGAGQQLLRRLLVQHDRVVHRRGCARTPLAPIVNRTLSVPVVPLVRP